MPIVSSEIVEDEAQADGRRWVRERHTDQLGVAHDFLYMAGADADVETIMAARISSIEDQLAADETAANLAEVTDG